MTNTDFLSKLQAEAQLQSTLNTTRFFPKQLDGLTSLIGRHPLPILSLSSVFTALFLEVLKRV